MNSRPLSKPVPMRLPRIDSTNRSQLKREQWITVANVVAPWLGALVTVAAMLFLGISLRPGWTGTALFVGGVLLSDIGLEIGYHRLFTHRAFEASGVLRGILVVLGSTAAEGPIFRWAAIHRRHHELSDRPGDPHSPHAKSWSGALGGLWHAHVGWMWNDDTSMQDYLRVTDLIQDPVLYRLGRVRMYYFWIALGLLLPAAIGAWALSNWKGALIGLLWGGFVRTIAKQHFGFSVNSIGHAFGWRTFRTDDESRDNPWIVLPTLGAGWQNTHHAFPSSWRTRILWWQLDPGEWVIRCFAVSGLAWNLRAPSASQIQAKRLVFGSARAAL